MLKRIKDWWTEKPVNIVTEQHMRRIYRSQVDSIRVYSADVTVFLRGHGYQEFCPGPNETLDSLFKHLREKLWD